MGMNSVSKKKPLILIVDDTPQNVQVLARTLEEGNYELAVATNGKDALAFVEREEPDLILLDVMMPEMNGYEVCRVLKKNEKTVNIPIIFLTAKRETDDIVKGFDAGGVDYIIKPFNSKELMARVKAHVELTLARREIQELQGIIPICSNCKNVRDDEGYWQRVEIYVETRSEASFSHGVCPDCMEKLYGDKEWYKKGKGKKE